MATKIELARIEMDELARIVYPEKNDAGIALCVDTFTTAKVLTAKLKARLATFREMAAHTADPVAYAAKELAQAIADGYTVKVMRVPYVPLNMEGPNAWDPRPLWVKATDVREDDEVVATRQ